MNNVSKSTIARTAVAIIALLNTVLVMMRKVPLELDENIIYELISILITISSTIIVWWKNNSFTAAAIAGDDTKRAAKLGIENIDAEIGTDRQEAESDDDDNGYSKEEE